VRPSPGDLLCLGYPGHDVFERVLTVPPVAGERLQEALRFEVGQAVRTPVTEMLIRHRLLARGRSPESELRALVVAAPRDHVLVLGEDLRRAGLRADLLESEPLALANFLDLERPAPLPLLALQVGRLRSDLVLLAQNHVFTRSFPYGAGHLLVESPAAEAAPTLALQLAKDIRATLAAPLAANLRPTRLLLLGPGATSEPLAGRLGRELAVEVDRLHAVHRLHHSLSRPPLHASDLSRFGTALGLALAGLDGGQLSVPLVPASRARRARRLAPTVALAALLASSLLLAFTYLEVKENTVAQRFLSERGPDVQADLLSRFTLESGELNATREQVVQLSRIAGAPTAMLIQLQSLIESAVNQLPSCRLLQVAVTREPRANELHGEARFAVGGKPEDAEARLNGMVRLLPLIVNARVERRQEAGNEVLVLSWQGEVGT
jgi:Tfp pilus assembly PilM family ATPase